MLECWKIPRELLTFSVFGDFEEVLIPENEYCLSDIHYAVDELDRKSDDKRAKGKISFSCVLFIRDITRRCGPNIECICFEYYD